MLSMRRTAASIPIFSIIRNIITSVRAIENGTRRLQKPHRAVGFDGVSKHDGYASSSHPSWRFIQCNPLRHCVTCVTQLPEIARDPMQFPSSLRHLRHTTAQNRARSNAIPAGSPRAVARPGFPQIRTCPIKASGSSSQEFATPLLSTLWTTRARGRLYRCSKRRNWDHVIGLPRLRRDSFRRHILRVACRNRCTLAILPVIP